MLLLEVGGRIEGQRMSLVWETLNFKFPAPVILGTPSEQYITTGNIQKFDAF